MSSCGPTVLDFRPVHLGNLHLDVHHLLALASPPYIPAGEHFLHMGNELRPELTEPGIVFQVVITIGDSALLIDLHDVLSGVL